jgi:hypothetical protein
MAYVKLELVRSGTDWRRRRGRRQATEKIRGLGLRAQCGDQHLHVVLGAAGGAIQNLDEVLLTQHVA